MKILKTVPLITKILFLTTVLIFNIDSMVAQIMVLDRTLKFSDLPGNIPASLNEASSHTITANQTQAINFGTYFVNGTGGGTVSIGWDGTRTSTGNIVLLNITPYAQPAIFEIKLLKGNSVTFTYFPTGILTGSNGGALSFDIGPTEQGINGSSFTVNTNTGIITPFKVGGTLHIPANAIQGTYSGNFDITFQQE